MLVFVRLGECCERALCLTARVHVVWRRVAQPSSSPDCSYTATLLGCGTSASVCGTNDVTYYTVTSFVAAAGTGAACPPLADGVTVPTGNGVIASTTTCSPCADCSYSASESACTGACGAGAGSATVTVTGYTAATSNYAGAAGTCAPYGTVAVTGNGDYTVACTACTDCSYSSSVTAACSGSCGTNAATETITVTGYTAATNGGASCVASDGTTAITADGDYTLACTAC